MNKSKHIIIRVTFAVINEKLNLILSLKSSMELGVIKRIDIPNKKNTSGS